MLSHLVMLHLGKDLEPFSLTTLAAVDLRLYCLTVPATGLGTTTADTMRMLEFVAKVALDVFQNAQA